MSNIRLSKHAEQQLVERELAVEWVELAVTAPDWVEPDSTVDPANDGSRSSSSVTDGCCA